MSMMLNPFVFAATPEIHFGSGVATKIPSHIKRFGTAILLVTGSGSIKQTDFYNKLIGELKDQNISVAEVSIPREPTPDMIDSCVRQFADAGIQVVVAIGGGSVLDAGKAISAMLPVNEPVKNFLEGVGTRQHPGIKIPMIAVPTTAGTGSEATKNAVLSEVGENGYKKSLRHQNFVPDIAVVDPELMLSCPPDITAWSGMDAFTQLLESYLSTSANTFTDSIAERGLFSIHVGLKHAVNSGTLAARAHMAHAALISGITLANAGLGTVHGFASSIGGYIDIPHGIICSRMMYACNKITVDKLRKKGNSEALKKYVYVGKLFTQKEKASDKYYVDALLGLIKQYTEELHIPSLSSYEFSAATIQRIVAATENKNNPVELNADELTEALNLSIG